MLTGELRYGWLYSPAGGVIDEVLLAKPGEARRVLTCHGGRAVREAVEEYFRENGVKKLAWRQASGEAAAWTAGDDLFCPELADCLTEGQAAGILAAWERGEKVPRVPWPVRRVAFLGAPNAGKSSLLNALAGYDRAFVDAAAGATRDEVEELVDVGGIPVWLCDLPGFSPTARDPLAVAAAERARERLKEADLIWLVVDGSCPWDDLAMGPVLAAAVGAEVLVVVNKSDLPAAWSGEPWRGVFPHAEGVWVSSLPDGDAAEVLAVWVYERWGRE